MSDLDQSDDESELNRRNFLKGVGAVGISAAAINHISENEATIGDISYNPQEEVPYVAGWRNEISDGEVNKEPFYDTVSVDKWDNVQATRDAIETLGNILQNEFESPDQHFSILGSTDEDSPTGRRIDLSINKESPYSVSELEEFLPDQATGKAAISEKEYDIPVGLRQGGIGQQSHSCYEDNYPLYDNVPAAAPIIADATMEGGNTAGAFWHGDNGIGWVTNYHVVDDGSPVGNIVSLLDDNDSAADTIGEVSDAYYEGGGEVDIAHILRTVSGKEPHEWIPRIDYSDNEEHAVVGVISDQKLENNVGNSNWKLSAQGHATCRSVGHIYDVEYSTSGELVGVIMDADYTQDGDSGGVLYYYDGSDAHICGVIVGPDKDTGHTYGTTAETTEDRFNGAWMTQ